MLKDKLALLFQMVAGGPGQPPVPEGIAIAELSPHQFGAAGLPVIVAAALRSPDQYEPRFNELLAMGFPWLNLSYYGLLDGKGLVVVELPGHSASLSPSTSVNFSGPMTSVAASGWDVRGHVLLQ